MSRIAHRAEPADHCVPAPCPYPILRASVQFVEDDGPRVVGPPVHDSGTFDDMGRIVRVPRHGVNRDANFGVVLVANPEKGRVVGRVTDNQVRHGLLHAPAGCRFRWHSLADPSHGRAWFVVTLRNFGGNVRFEAREVVTPAHVGGVLECLDRIGDGSNRQVRPVGRLHSWSDVVACESVVLDLRDFNGISLETLENGDIHVEMGAGCTIDEVLDFLASHGRYTLPTFGMTGRQTIAGAIATATHGTGRSTLSHYVTAALVAAYDSHTGKARTFRWEDGDRLRAIRCGLGCAGIVLSIRMRVVHDYPIEERTAWFDRLEQALSEEPRHPIQQFYLVPWSWRWFSQLRRPLDPDTSAPEVMARLQRAFRFTAVDVGLNGAVCLMSNILGWGSAIRWWYRRLFPLVARSGMRRVDRCRHVAMMRHDLYKHVEMELFVPVPHISHAAAFVEWVLRQCGGESSSLSAAIAQDNYSRDVSTDIAALRGRYVHDHPILFRKVLRDDALISMTSGDDADAWYAISFITYQRDLGPFLAMCDFVAAAMASAYRARPHWGKICPLKAEQLAPLYPHLVRFRAHCEAVDPKKVFVNEFAEKCLGL